MDADDQAAVDLAQAPPRRDVRVDRIGYAAELVKHYLDPLKAAVKAAHPPGARLEGDKFDARIVPTSSTEIPFSKWYGLWQRKRLRFAVFAAPLTVNAGAAAKLIDADTYDKIATTAAGSPRLTVARKQGVEIALVHAVRDLSARIEQLEAERADLLARAAG